MRGGRRAAPGRGEDFTFVSPVVKYLLFLFNFLFWVSADLLKPPQTSSRDLKAAELAALACLAVDPAVMLMVVGVLMFFITFCGCVGSLRENICLLQTVRHTHRHTHARDKVTEMINKAITHYRDDIDLQNLIDFGQREFGCCGGVAYTDWSKNMYFNCRDDNPSRERCSVPFSCCLLTKEKVPQ
uniref:Tetraspanin-33 n=1 Tax=Periophthalmus magnuspinnatus TaxID=409849 RepID=A0A3B3ZPW3_9GOBI